MKGPLCFIIIISGKGNHTHVCAALTKGLYPDGNGATTYCTINTSSRLSSQHRPHMAWDWGQTMHYPSPPNLHCFQLDLL